MRIIYGDRRVGKTEAMLNWFLGPPILGTQQRLIVVANEEQRSHIQDRLRNWGTQNRIQPTIMAGLHRRVVVWGLGFRKATMGMTITEVWIDNLDQILQKELGLRIELNDFTFSLSTPVHVEKIIHPWSTLKEIK